MRKLTEQIRNISACEIVVPFERGSVFFLAAIIYGTAVSFLRLAIIYHVRGFFLGRAVIYGAAVS